VSHFETSLANLDIEGGLETDFEAGEEITPKKHSPSTRIVATLCTGLTQ